jgi:hypothetical protein
VSPDPFEELAGELSARDRGLAEALRRSCQHLTALRDCAADHVAAFVAAARRGGGAHLVDLCVGLVEPDEKRVDSLQFKVQRGRWEIVCVAKPRGVVTLVGPYRRGKPEHPCQEHPLPGDKAQAALVDLLLQLIREASER